MANDNIGGKVLIVLELPDGGILRGADLPADPEHKKGHFEIIEDIIQKGIENTDWSIHGMSTNVNASAFTLKYGGQ